MGMTATEHPLVTQGMPDTELHLVCQCLERQPVICLGQPAGELRPLLTPLTKTAWRR